MAENQPELQPGEEYEIVPANSVVAVIYVDHTDELEGMADDINAFIDTLGGGTIAVQLMVNTPDSREELAPVVGFATHELDNGEEGYDDDDYPEDSRKSKTGKARRRVTAVRKKRG